MPLAVFTGNRKGCPRLLVPRMVPPVCRIPRTSLGLRSLVFFVCRSPPKLSSMPSTSQPKLWAVRKTARITAFNPAQSPPPVKIPILFLAATSRNRPLSIELENGPRHPLHLSLGDLRVKRQGKDLAGRSFGFRTRSHPLTQALISRLEMRGDRVVNERFHPGLRQSLSQPIPLRRSHHQQVGGGFRVRQKVDPDQRSFRQ